jgi:hypothetical protein
VIPGGVHFLVVQIARATKAGQGVGDRLAHTCVFKKRDLVITSAGAG